jgi:sugar lactone lactonase YvrE
MKKGELNPRQTAVAGVMIAGMLACLGLMVHAGNALNRDVGPSALAVAPDGRLFVASHGKVHVFTKEGRREQAFDLRGLGVDRIPADLAVRSDGRLLVADPSAALLAVCDLQKGRCGGRDLGLPGWTAEHLMPGNTFKFALDEAQGRIYISDNGGNRLVIADHDGKVLSRSGGREVHFPNQIRSYAPGEVTVVDTNNRRVATFDVSGDKVGRVVRAFSTDAPGVARAGRSWPFAMARLPDGGYWVLLAANGMKNADVILFSGDGKARKRVDLGEASDPFAIALWNGWVLVADARTYRLHAFNADGSELGQLSEADWDRELDQHRATAATWKLVRLLATLGVILFPLLGIGVLVAMGASFTGAKRP